MIILPNSLSTLWAYSLEEKPIDNSLTAIDNDGEIKLKDDFFDESATYQWVNCDKDYSPVSGYNDKTTIIPDGSSYALVTTYSKGGKDTSDCYTYQKVSSSIAEDPNSDFFRTYPNPVQNYIYINSKNHENKKHHTKEHKEPKNEDQVLKDHYQDEMKSLKEKYEQQ